MTTEMQKMIDDLEDLIRSNQITWERTGNAYYKGKMEAYQVARGMLLVFQVSRS